MATYKSSYTGPQIDQAVGNALIKDTATLSNDVNHIPASSVVKSALTHDLANIVATGSTNTTGAEIAAGTYFYLNGTLVRAKANIAVNATFTSGTNYETVTAGGLNELRSAITSLQSVGVYTGTSTSQTFTISEWESGSVFFYQLFVRWSSYNYYAGALCIDSDGHCGLLEQQTSESYKINSASFNTSTKVLTISMSNAYAILYFKKV